MNLTNSVKNPLTLVCYREMFLKKIKVAIYRDFIAVRNLEKKQKDCSQVNQYEWNYLVLKNVPIFLKTSAKRWVKYLKLATQPQKDLFNSNAPTKWERCSKKWQRNSVAMLFKMD